jgi:parallel beta-helix repeat protein
MKQYPLIGVSIIAVVVLILGSLTNIVGVQSRLSSVKEPSNRNILASEQLEYSGLWTHPDKTQYDSINSFNVWTPKPQTPRTPHTTIPYSMKSNDSNSVKKSSIMPSRGKTLYVGGTGPGNYSSVQFAVYSASEGDTVFVYSGTYHIGRYPDIFSRIYINKSINLIGENRETTILDGEKRPIKLVDVLDAIIDIWANGVTVSGFTIKNSGDYYIYDSGITIRGSNNNISGNIISNNNCGIWLCYPYGPVDYNSISDNIFVDNVEYGMMISGAQHTIVSDNVFNNNGVWHGDSYQNTFLNNSVNGKPLIYLEGKSDTIINEDAGQVILVNCDNITVQNKDLSDATVGIILEGTHNCLISGNIMHSDKWAGIYIYDSDNNNISMNIISNSTFYGDAGGILIDNSKNNVVFSNSITLSEGIGIALYDFSENNTILMNTFSDNQRGLVLTGGAEFNTVTDNVFFNDGVFVYGAWENTFLNNSVNNKPLLYLEDESGMIVDDDAGQVILVSCDSITVHNQKISNVCAGIMVIASINCLITDNILDSNKEYGIFLTHSSGTNVSLNTVSNSFFSGIYFDTSNYNIVLWNTISSNKNSGICVSYSNDITILSNTIEKNCIKQRYIGSIILYESSSNTIQKNNFLHNVEDAFFEGGSSNNWNGNYWDRPRLFPKLIGGFFPNYNFDWHPAQKPYDIPGIS